MTAPDGIVISISFHLRTDGLDDVLVDHRQTIFGMNSDDIAQMAESLYLQAIKQQYAGQQSASSKD